MTSIANFTISKLADSAGVNVETIRYYHRQGLLIEPPKPKQGYRTYSEGHLSRVRFIKKAQVLGFTLSEIKQLLSLSDGSCSEVKTLAESKLQTIHQKLTDLKSLENVLSELVDACNSNSDQDRCPIIESLVNNAVE